MEAGLWRERSSRRFLKCLCFSSISDVSIKNKGLYLTRVRGIERLLWHAISILLRIVALIWANCYEPIIDSAMRSSVYGDKLLDSLFNNDVDLVEAFKVAGKVFDSKSHFVAIPH